MSKTESVAALASELSKRPTYKNFSVWIVGETPLIVHAWSHKAKIEMLSKMVGATKAARAKRDPQQDFIDSLYEMGDGRYGFPVTGIKNCILSAAHKDKGIPRSTVMSALWLNAEMVRSRPALAGAICDMPLVRIHGSEPQMREDMVRVGAGLNKTANLAYRAQFTVWAIRFTGRFNASVLTDQQLAFLLMEGGVAFGLGEWRNEKKGIFGAFHVATPDEEAAWDAFADGTGPMPMPAQYAQAAE